MSIVTYFRSSSLKAVDHCEQQFFGEYILGLGNHEFFEKSESVKTTNGTISHKVLECIANIKKAMDGDKCFIEDEHLGRISFVPDAVMTPYTLSDEEVDKINKGRKNKAIYKNQNSCKIKYGHTRYGVLLVEKLIQKAYDYYSTRIEQDWKPSHLRDITNFVWMLLDYSVGKKKGMYDPRNRKILAVEPHFDFELKEDWAKYDYDYKGERLKGYLSLKGTIDLVTELDKDTIEVVDYKSGESKDWNTGLAKTYSDLEKDIQLLLYNLAVRQMFPKYKNVITTIFFIRDGGPTSIPMDDDECIKLVKEKIREKFEYVKGMASPKLCDPTHNHMKCKYLCPLFKNSFPKAPQVNCCTYLKKYIDKHGTEKAIANLTGPGHDVSKYKSPGET